MKKTLVLPRFALVVVCSALLLNTRGAENGDSRLLVRLQPESALSSQSAHAGNLSSALLPDMPGNKRMRVSARGPQVTGNVSLRNRYVRTDAQWSGAHLIYNPQRWIFYDSATRRFFVSNTTLGRVEVFDAEKEVQIGEIPVPGAWTGDISPDHKTIYMGTILGNLYEIDPVNLVVTRFIPSTQIGPAGFAAYSARVMADGRVALLGTPGRTFFGGIPFGGIQAIHGFSGLVIWNPADNSVKDNKWGGRSIFDFNLSADRTKIILAEPRNTEAVVTVIDPVTETEKSVIAPGIGNPFTVLVPSDGKSLLVPFGVGVTVYDADTLTQMDQFAVGNGQEGFRFILSPDGNILYALGMVGTPPSAFAIDWKRHTVQGRLGNFTITDQIENVLPMTADSTGLIIGVIGQGVAFLDASVLLPAAPKFMMSVCCYPIQPSYGPAVGGTQVQEFGIANGIDLAAVYFGSRPAMSIWTDEFSWNAVTPPGDPGPVNVMLTGSDGAMAMLPDGFSYGPSIVNLTTNAATAEGAPTGRVYGYGFGSSKYGTNDIDSSLKITVGGHEVTNMSYSNTPWGAGMISYPFPSQTIQFNIPPGIPGTSADLVISNATGTTTEHAAITYYPQLKRFPLTGSSLAQGIYDRRKDLYYFTDRTTIRVFSRTGEAWLTPVSIPNARQLWSLSLSPDGKLLAVSESEANSIHVLSTDSLTLIRSFPMNPDPFEMVWSTYALAITNNGVVYFTARGSHPLRKLDTTTGKVSTIYAAIGGVTPFEKMIISKDNRQVFFNVAGEVYVLDVVTDKVDTNHAIFQQGNEEVALSGDETWLAGAGYVMDTRLNPESFITQRKEEIWNENAVHGQKLSRDGSYLFRPLEDGLDILDGRTCVLLSRLALPLKLSPIHDALVADGRDNVLVAITGAQGDGIAVIDLSSLPTRTGRPRTSVDLDLGPAGASAYSTAAGSGSTQTGYAALDINSGTAPYGTAVFSFRQNGVTVSEAGVPSSPPTDTARVFIDYRFGVLAIPSRNDSGLIDINTGVALVNCSANTASVTYTLRNEAGANISVGHGTIAGRAHHALFIDQLKAIAPDFDLPSDFSTRTRFASLEVSSDQPLSIVALRQVTNQRREVLFTTTPVADLTQRSSSEPAYFAQFADGGGYTTSLVLLNASAMAETGTFEILDDHGTPWPVTQVDGATNSKFRYGISPRGFLRFQTDGRNIEVHAGWVRLVPDTGTSTPVGAAVFSHNPENVLITESGAPATGSTSHARIYLDLSGDHNTGLAIANVAATSSTINVKAFQSDGVTGAGTSNGPLQLIGGGHLARFADQLIAGLPEGFTGVLDIRSTTPIAALTLRSLYNERHDFLLTTLPVADLNQSAPSPAMFPQIADGGGFLTQFILLNTGEPSSVTINFYDQVGKALAIGK